MKKILSVFLAVIMLLSTMAIGVSAADFKDTANHWGAEYINYWTAENAVGGYQDGSFRPDNSVTRGEVAQIIANILKLVPTGNVNPFKDMPADAWYYNAILACYEAGVFKGFPDKTIRANDSITREQAIVLIARITNVTPNASAASHFVDSKQASSWAAGAIGALFGAGVLDGYTTAAGAEVRPQNTVTRAEFLKLFATVDKASNVSYTVGTRTTSEQEVPDQPIIIPAIVAGTTNTTTYYNATVKIACGEEPKDNDYKVYNCATKASGNDSILAKLVEYFYNPNKDGDSIEVFGDLDASKAALALVKAFNDNGKQLNEEDIKNLDVEYKISLDENNTKDGVLADFIKSDKFKDNVGTHTFKYTVNAAAPETTPEAAPEPTLLNDNAPAGGIAPASGKTYTVILTIEKA